MAAICALIFKSIVFTIMGYVVAITVALLTDDLIDNDVEG